MKKTIYTIAAISTVAALCLLGKVVALNNRLDESNAKLEAINSKVSAMHETAEKVLAVLKQEEQSRKSHFDGNTANPTEFRHYLVEIQKINVESCPVDFRDAWRDFLASCTFRVEHPILDAGKRQSEWPHEKRRELEAYAAKYGVVFKAP